METRRFALIALLGVLLFFTYQAWEKDYGSGATPATQASSSAPTAGASAGRAADNAPVAAPIVGTQPATGDAAAAGSVEVDTGLLHVRIALAGGGLQKLVLERYPVDKRHPEQKLALLDNSDASSSAPYFVFQTGLAGTGKPLSSADTHYVAARTHYRMAAGDDVLDVPLTATDAAGDHVETVYRFHRNSYQIDLIQRVTNAGDQPLQVGAYARWLRNTVQAGEPQKFVHSYFGIGVYERKSDGGYRFRKIKLDDLKDDPFSATQSGGWLSMLQQYFIAAVIPAAGEKVTFSAKPAGDGRYYAQMQGATASVAPGATHSFQTGLYVGPKLQGKLDAVAPGLELTEDYGLFTPIAKPLFWVLTKFYQLTGNWGWSIILLTFVIRAAFFKLSEAQYRSMAKMRKFGPRIKDLRERYAGDRERLNKAMMELYKKEKFNPLAGCWPMLLQFPVFISLYWVLIESVELRQAPFILWLQDLSSPDPYYVLPIIYGVSMWFQQRLSGQTATMDPTQQKIMNVMPIGLAGFFSFFPSGLVLYYCVSNAFTIAQQVVITRRLEKEGLSRR